MVKKYSLGPGRNMNVWQSVRLSTYSRNEPAWTAFQAYNALGIGFEDTILVF
jgi:hypothetical protein